jgi:hypothetical protein
MTMQYDICSVIPLATPLVGVVSKTSDEPWKLEGICIWKTCVYHYSALLNTN